jgi:hypothetical protein
LDIHVSAPENILIPPGSPQAGEQLEACCHAPSRGAFAWAGTF